MRRLERQGRSVPDRFARPPITPARMIEIFERERAERRRPRRTQKPAVDRLPDHNDDLEDRWLD
ncbi:MAG: hypothetical protein AAF368_20810 [Planctomycetota bacterium]